MTKVKCANCGKLLKRGEKEYCEKYDASECAECRYLALVGARSIKEYNRSFGRDFGEKSPAKGAARRINCKEYS